MFNFSLTISSSKTVKQISFPYLHDCFFTATRNHLTTNIVGNRNCDINKNYLSICELKKKELKLYLRTALGTSLNFHCVYSFSPQIQELQIQFYLASLLLKCVNIYTWRKRAMLVQSEFLFEILVSRSQGLCLTFLFNFLE